MLQQMMSHGDRNDVTKHELYKNSNINYETHRDYFHESMFYTKQ